MARTKLKRLTKVKELPNVFSFEKSDLPDVIRDYFRSDLFTIEIGCGHGDYSVELAQKYPGRNFIGIDVKGARIFNGALKAIDQNLNNVVFIIAKAEKLNEIFQPKSIEEIFIPFPDPHVRRASNYKRLISPVLLRIYKDLLINSGLLHFKTDNQGLYDYAIKTISDFECEILYSTEDLYENDGIKYSSNVITNFEKHYIKERRKIRYICFRF
jgi:tRNA (guanine-N7-)-methyltransferase